MHWMYNIYIPDLLISTKQLPINEPNFPIKEQFSYVKSHINTDRGLNTKVNMFTVRLDSSKTENE